jgi:mono/diheme cytochrome c family protein
MFDAVTSIGLWISSKSYRNAYQSPPAIRYFTFFCIGVGFNYLDRMDKKFSISVSLTIGAFILTVAVVLFVVVVITLNGLSSDSVTSTPSISSAPQQQEIDHPGQKIFKANCTPCHRIHQKLVGPALAGVLERRDSLWVIKMIRNSSQLIASGDPTAVELFRAYNGTQMTSFTSFSDEELKSLLEYIKLESAREYKPVPAPSRTEV